MRPITEARSGQGRLFGTIDLAIRSRNLLPPHQAVLVGVSGGLDSTVLLHILHRLASSHQWTISVAHFNHQLRGKSSDADEALVRSTTEALGLTFFRDAADVKEFSRRQKLSLEMAARRFRHEFFARLCRMHGIHQVALAHHADDQLELFFLRLLRGAGGEGLAGMDWVSPSPADAQIQLVRPLLGVTKTDLQSFAEQEGISYRQDASNTDVGFERNRVRHRLLPLLQKEFQPALLKTTLRLMEIVGAESDFVDQAARAWKAGKKRTAFERLHVAVQRQVLRISLLEMGIVPDFDLTEQLRCSPNRPVTVHLHLSLWRDRKGLLYTRRVGSPDFKLDEKVVEITGPEGSTEFAGLTISWQIQPLRPAPARLPPRRPNGECFDAQRIGPSVVLRHWRPGDRFQPIGLKRAVKLQDLFTNQKIPRALRHQWVVATTAQGAIFWVEGLRIAERFKLGPGTSLRLRWSWQREAAGGPAA